MSVAMTTASPIAQLLAAATVIDVAPEVADAASVVLRVRWTPAT